MFTVELEMSIKLIFLLVYFTTANSDTNLKSVTVSVKTEYKFTFNYDSPNSLRTQNISNGMSNAVLKENPLDSDYIDGFNQKIIHNKSKESIEVISNVTKVLVENNKQFQTENNDVNSKSVIIRGKYANSVIRNNENSKEIKENIQRNDHDSSRPKSNDHEGDTKENNADKIYREISSEDKTNDYEMSLENTRRSLHTAPVWLKTEQLDTSAPNSFQKIRNENKSSRFPKDERVIDQKKKKHSQYYVFFQNSNEESDGENLVSQSVTKHGEEGRDEKIAVETSTIPFMNGYVEEDHIGEIDLRSLNLAKKLGETTTKYNSPKTNKRDVPNANTTNTKANISKYTFFENSKEALDSNVENNSFISKPMTPTEHLMSVTTYFPFIDAEWDRMNADLNSDSSENVDLRRFNKFPGAKTKYDATTDERIFNDFYTTSIPTYDSKEETASEYSFFVQNSDDNKEKIIDDGVTKRYTFFDDSDLYDQEPSENKIAITQLQTPQYEPSEDIAKEYLPKSGENENLTTRLKDEKIKTAENNTVREENGFQFKTTQSSQSERSLLLEETATEIAKTSSTLNDSAPRASWENIGTSNTRRDANNPISVVYEDSQLDIVLLREVKKIVAKLNPGYFMVVADQLSMQSTAHLGKQTSTFAISPVCLTALLLTMTLGMKGQSRTQIDEALKYRRNNEERIRAVELLLDLIPSTGTKLSSWSTTRLFVPDKLVVHAQFKSQAQRALKLNMESVNTVDGRAALQHVNKAIEIDTKGRMPNAFDDDDLQDSLESGGLLLANCLYWRGDWRGSATVLNGTRIFHTREGDQDLAMYRLNDVMRYADVPDWNAHVVEIPYAAKDAWLVLLIPREVDGLNDLEDLILNDENKTDIFAYLDSLLTIKRVQITLPKFTLESRIMLPSKLREFGMDAMLSNSADLDGIVDGVTRLGSAVQRTKWWADDGRGSFKDDGLQWDPLPDIEVFADRPYIFMLKVEDVVLISGHFYGSGR